MFVSLDSQDVAGEPPEICLWELPARKCASLPPLPSSSRWRHFQAAATIPPNQQVSLFLYATPDRSGNLATSAFADVSVQRLPELLPTLDLVGTPQQVDKEGQLWVLGESSGQGWRSTTGGDPVTVDGMLSGWIEPHGTKSAPTINFAPGHLIQIGQLVSLTIGTAGVALFLVWGVRAARQRRRRAGTKDYSELGSNSLVASVVSPEAEAQAKIAAP